MSESNEPHIKPGRLPPMRTDEVIARAQRILEVRGWPPYTVDQYYGVGKSILSDDEVAIINEFMTHWAPYLAQKKSGA